MFSLECYFANHVIVYSHIHKIESKYSMNCYLDYPYCTPKYKNKNIMNQNDDFNFQ